MSIFNHMGKLVSVDGEWATYEYYPDYLGNKDAFGLFKVRPLSLLADGCFDFEFLQRIEGVKLWYKRPEEQVIYALLNKIRSSACNGELYPESVYHNA